MKLDPLSTFADDQPQSTSPAFVLTGSRSGSTLLRFILDTHPDLHCPPETGLGSLCAAIARAASVLDGSAMKEVVDNQLLTPAAEKVLRATVEQIFQAFPDGTGAGRWCDKSLDNINHADLLAQTWPEAKYICLVRHCMDVVASAVEACPWGLTGFGLDQFNSHYPGNSIAAVAAYWLQTTTNIIEFARQHDDQCLVIRYEDLVSRPADVTRQIWVFLGVREVPGIAESCLTVPHSATGPSDEKIWFTRQIHKDSVGRGVTVPITGLPPMMTEAINQLCNQLGYRNITGSWNSDIEAIDPRADLGVYAGTTAADGSRGQRADQEALTTLKSLIEDRLATYPRDLGQLTKRWPRLAGRTIGITLYADAIRTADYTWTIPGAGPRLATATADDSATSRLIGHVGAWTRILAGNADVAVELMHGNLRMVGPASPGRLCSDEAHAICELLNLTHGGDSTVQSD
jgi:protein-tyrosine sulfotransferase